MKSAYLIMAHNNFNQLKLLLELLDSPDNDIFLHIDKKANDFCLQDCMENIKYSNVSKIESISVNWGGFSIVECEMNLIKAAINNHYDYYHLLSGQDLPLHSQEEFKNFLSENSGKEFVHFANKQEIERCRVVERIQYYHWFQEKIKSKNKTQRQFFILLKNITIGIQRLFHIKRKIDKEIQFGSQWFSITHAFADYLVKHECEINSMFRYSRCADELFIQTTLYNSPYYNNVFDLSREKVFEGCLRLIDFERGNGKGSPYVYTFNDKDILDSSKCFFARKFDIQIDSKIVLYLYDKLKLKQ